MQPASVADQVLDPAVAGVAALCGMLAAPILGPGLAWAVVYLPVQWVVVARARRRRERKTAYVLVSEGLAFGAGTIAYALVTLALVS
jgi:hypothetical protein